MSKLLRQAHRWISMIFMAGVIFNTIIIAMVKGEQPPSWVYLFALVPLFLLMASGTYLFFQPYVAKLRRGRAA